MGSSQSSHNQQGRGGKKKKDRRVLILRLIVEIEIQAGQKIRGLQSSMCEGSHYKPQYVQVESFMSNNLLLETLGDVALITGRCSSWKRCLGRFSSQKPFRGHDKKPWPFWLKKEKKKRFLQAVKVVKVCITVHILLLQCSNATIQQY